MLVATHLHLDHFDTKATELLPKNLPLICQPDDIRRLDKFERGFENLHPVYDVLLFDAGLKGRV